MKFQFNSFGTDGKEYGGVVAAVDLKEAKSKLTTAGYPDHIQIDPTDDNAPESCTEVETRETETVQEADERRLQEEERSPRGNRRQGQQQPPEDEELPVTATHRGIPLWAKVTAAVVGALLVGGILYAVASNSRASRKAIEALEAKIASLAANPSQPPPTASPALGAVAPPGITATNSVAVQPQPPQPQQPQYIPGPGPGATGSYNAGPYGVVIDNRFTVINGGAGTTSTNRGSAGKPQGTSGGLLVLKVGSGEYNEFPPYTRVATAIVPSNTTTNNPTAPVIKAIGADRYLIYPRSDVWVKVKYEDGSEREWAHVSPAKPLSGSFSQVQSLLLAAFDTNAPPVPVRFQFRSEL